ncbi:hypothetical protein Cni_G29383 [Canna indica]|uniref:Uncharacterized protein n=1 Tax=Canna indica TaxID=4628 RepID=A0AAQ3QTJ0_9LILI|nr:hypothetical protein Cni_G29383 [Canna indica]
MAWIKDDDFNTSFHHRIITNKAFDKLSWKAIFHVLHSLGFPILSLTGSILASLLLPFLVSLMVRVPHQYLDRPAAILPPPPVCHLHSPEVHLQSKTRRAPTRGVPLAWQHRHGQVHFTVQRWRQVWDGISGHDGPSFSSSLSIHSENKSSHLKLWKTRLGSLFFLFLAVVLAAQLGSPPDRLWCLHCWAPIGFLSHDHLAFYAATTQTLWCIHSFKYQCHCQKLTLVVATDRLKLLMICCSMAADEDTALLSGVVEINYQKPLESYLGKFR